MKSPPFTTSCTQTAMTMQALLEKNGFQIKEVFGHFDKRPYDYKNGEMIFVAQKKG